MDFLKSVGGMFTSSVLRLGVTVGTLAAVYFFLLKPVLDTTNESIDRFSRPINQSLALSQQQLRQAQRQIQRNVRQEENVPAQQVPGQIKITRTLSGLTPRQAKRLTRCIGRAQGVEGFNRCFDRFSRK
jgi:hypothetical protein